MKNKTAYKLSKQGQLNIPVNVREALGWKEGDSFRFITTLEGVIVTKVKNAEPPKPKAKDKEAIAKKYLADNDWMYDEDPVIIRRGNKTIVDVPGWYTRLHGEAVCAPDDKFSPYIGEAIALARAYDMNDLPKEFFM